MYIRKDWEIDPLPIFSNNNTGGKNASSTPSWWTTKSKEAWSNSFGKNANAATKANSAAAALGALGSMATTTFSLATPSKKNYYNQLKDNITALNNTRINTTNLDAIDSMQRQWRPLKTNYSWKDFYANGGYLEPHRFDAGGRAAMGIFGNTATGAATGAQIGGPWGALVGGVLGLGSGLFGFFKGHSKAKKMANRINNWSDEANNGMQYKFGSAVDNAKQQNALGLDLSTPYAYGGLMDLANSDMGAIDYGFMTDYLNMKNSQAQAKNNTVGYLGNIPSEPMAFADGGGIHIAKSKEGTYKAAADRRDISMSELADRIKANPENYSTALRRKANFYNNFARHKKSDGGNLLIGNNGDTLFALGGDMQTNGGDYSDGLKEINAGKSHEENPYQGVQMGVAPDGSPNLVEEGETIFNDEDYVFSNRIHPKKEVLKKFHMYSKGSKLTYADVSKRLEKEAKERPNDPISKASLKDMLTMLMDAQEQQKAEEEAKEAKKAFEALSPEEQKAVLEQIAQQQQAQANAEQQANPKEEQEVPVDENGNPIEQTEEMPNQEDIAQNDEGSMNAYGGSLHKFPNGGQILRDNLFNRLGIHSIAQWINWLNSNGISDDTEIVRDWNDVDWDNYDWNNLLYQDNIRDKITELYPDLADAIDRGYDFGVYKPTTSNNLTFDFLHGGWGKEDYNAWNGSTDAAWKEAVAKGLVKKGMKSAEIGEALRKTDAYKKGSDWLKASADNRLKYLQAIYNSKDAPKAARDYAAKYVDANGWLKDAKQDYATIFENPNSQGVRNTHPGTFWKTPDEILRDKEVKSYIYDPESKTYSEVIGDVNKKWKLQNTYNWDDKDMSHVANYYIDPAIKAAADAQATKHKPTLEAVHKPEWLRYAGLLGPAIGLGLWSAGVGKPDTKGLDAAMEYASQANGKADYMPIGDYLRYNPMDIWAQENRNDANARATDRAIVNNNTTAGSKMAGLLANGYNSQVADASLFRQAQEYNDAQRQKVAEFNRSTNMFNADAYNKTSQTNAKLQNENAQFRANLAAQIANQKMNADSQWYNAFYGNIGSLFQGVGDLGRENAQHNMIADMAANSLFGTMNPDTPIAKGQHLFRYVDADGNTVDKDGNIIKKKAKGGKLKRRKGLTF